MDWFFWVNKDFFSTSNWLQFAAPIHRGNLRHYCPDIKAKKSFWIFSSDLQAAGDNKRCFPHSRWFALRDWNWRFDFCLLLAIFSLRKVCKIQIRKNNRKEPLERGTQTLSQIHLTANWWVFVQCKPHSFNLLACKKAIERDDLIFNPIVSFPFQHVWQ